METVGKLAGGVAHEFNSILTTIIGQCELLLGELPVRSPLADSALEITKAADRAVMLTRQLLAYGRKQMLRPEVLDLNGVVARMEGMLSHLLGADVRTRVILAPGPQTVRVDARQIEQVIMNMAINAREAMPRGGGFTLETAGVTLDREKAGRYPDLKPGAFVRLAITDTGAGMGADILARVFDPFFSTKDVGQGTGLGLSTCEGIIKQSGGTIGVESEPGRGTTFKIYLPRIEERTTPVAAARPAPPDLPGGTETILVVEDDRALREMVVGLLRRLGYTVLSAANGWEALAMKPGPGVDLLFTDVVMPGMSGKELAARARLPHPGMRVLFTSGAPGHAMVQPELSSERADFLQKPFTPSALARKLREILG